MSGLLPRAGLRRLRVGGFSRLLRPHALMWLLGLAIVALALLLTGVTQGSLPVPASSIGRALFFPHALSGEQQYVVWDIRLPRVLMALMCGAMLGMAGGLLAAGLVMALARDVSRPRFVLLGIGVSWTFAAGIGAFMTTADVRDVQTAMMWLAGSLHAATWPLLMVALCWAVPATLILLVTVRAADVALLGNQAATGLGVRLAHLQLLRFIAPVLLTAASVSCVGSIGFVGLIAPHMARFLLRGGQRALLWGSAMLGGLLVLLADSLGRLAFAPLQIPAGILISLIGGPFFLLLLWQRRDRL